MNLSGVANAILGGWTVNGVFYLSTGIPSVRRLSAPHFLTSVNGPNMTCNPGKGAPHTAEQWV